MGHNPVQLLQAMDHAKASMQQPKSRQRTANHMAQAQPGQRTTHTFRTCQILLGGASWTASAEGTAGLKAVSAWERMSHMSILP